MNLGTLILSTTLTLLGGLAITVSPSAHGADSKIITFAPPGAGTGAYQGTGCFSCTFGIT